MRNISISIVQVIRKPKRSLCSIRIDLALAIARRFTRCSRSILRRCLLIFALDSPKCRARNLSLPSTMVNSNACADKARLRNGALAKLPWLTCYSSAGFRLVQQISPVRCLLRERFSGDRASGRKHLEMSRCLLDMTIGFVEALVSSACLISSVLENKHRYNVVVSLSRNCGSKSRRVIPNEFEGSLTRCLITQVNERDARCDCEILSLRSG